MGVALMVLALYNSYTVLRIIRESRMNIFKMIVAGVASLLLATTAIADPHHNGDQHHNVSKYTERYCRAQLDRLPPKLSFEYTTGYTCVYMWDTINGYEPRTLVGFHGCKFMTDHTVKYDSRIADPKSRMGFAYIYRYSCKQARVHKKLK